MSEIHWIKLNVGMPDDEKIQIIEATPELGDAFLVTWIRLLILAGRGNANGFIFITENIPYTPKQLSIIFHKPVEIVNAALTMFTNLQMIEIDQHNIIKIKNWEKHQSVEGMERVRSLTKARVEKFRLNQKNSNVTVTQCNAIDLDSDIRLIDQWFEKFWKEYPKKVAKEPATKSFKKVCKNKKIFFELMDGLKKYKQSEQWVKDSGQFIPNPTTFLNQERWKDELTMTNEMKKTEFQHSPFMQQMMTKTLEAANGQT